MIQQKYYFIMSQTSLVWIRQIKVDTSYIQNCMTELHGFLNSSQEINYVFDFIEAQLEVLRCKKMFSNHYLSNDIEKVNL